MSVRPATATVRDSVVVARATSRLRRSFRTLFRRVPAMLSLVVVVGVVSIAIAAPAIAPRDPYEQSLDHRLTPPVWAGGTLEHPLGTDQLGRDVLSRLIFGTRISLLVGVTAAFVAGITGVAAGVAAGFYGGLVDEVLMRLADLRLALPFVLLVIAVIAVFGPSLFNVIVVLSLTGWVLYARVIRAEVLSMREREFVLAARAMGATDGRLMFRHILPNTLASAIVIASLELANMILDRKSVV